MKKNKKTYLYPVVIEPHQEGGFHAKCPKLQGAWADGETIEEAVDSLQDVIKAILQYQRERKKKLAFPAVLPPTQARSLSDLNVKVYA